jgi:hypothetical protein
MVCWTFAILKSCVLTGGPSFPHSSGFTRRTLNLSQFPGRIYSSHFSLSFASLSFPANLLQLTYLTRFTRCTFTSGPVLSSLLYSSSISCKSLSH